jgi:hypothetical protein
MDGMKKYILFIFIGLLVCSASYSETIIIKCPEYSGTINDQQMVSGKTSQGTLITWTVTTWLTTPITINTVKDSYIAHYEKQNTNPVTMKLYCSSPTLTNTTYQFSTQYNANRCDVQADSRSFSCQ